jgi:hypothetical protein
MRLTGFRHKGLKQIHSGGIAKKVPASGLYKMAWSIRCRLETGG